jgi:hypothetical protein
VNPGIGAPGGVAEVVLRTYAPRSIQQGQILISVVSTPPPVARRGPVPRVSRRGQPLGAKSTATIPPLVLEGVTVFSVLDDCKVTKAVLNGQTAQVSFQSPSGSVNAADGPMIVLRFRIDPSVVPGTLFDLSLDPAQTRLTDALGTPVTVSPQSGTLTVRAPGDPFLVQAGDSKVPAGGAAEVGVNTFEPFPVSGGRFTLTWDPRIASGPPAVRLDPRYGQATYTVDDSQPGRLVVDFESPDASFNSIPGTVVAVSLPVDPGALTGDATPFALDPLDSWLLDAQGNPIPVTLEDGVIIIQ